MFEAKHQLDNKRIAILATDGFEESELFEPKKALEDAGAKVNIISLKSGDIKAWKKTDWGKSIHVDAVVGDANQMQFDALMIPGGVMNPDKLRNDKKAVDFVKSFVSAGKPIASICHGPQVLIETGMTKGKTMTSWSSLKTDLTNSGANWVDREVVVDDNLITSRSPDDIPAFNKKMIEGFAATPKRK
ncbi:type 1 glutamine amidotransferase domain-containing protein [Bacteriovorax sp. PP10]|uniref:Type 1 glutamine amidotransferase domain-containing protein n=1 Tax=Bacteriovorax antarcticus TaxID=3088717 RepID=A0ABU5VX92_9BACT|nr:type 1 glutamine amidotransferase domain-containing protein [Bacteriovorax sp. PP10]MEA9357679.1 type 1 glutamine amidotransferase domain-containing protein [Bacteriovorax sp. PP10]